MRSQVSQYSEIGCGRNIQRKWPASQITDHCSE